MNHYIDKDNYIMFRLLLDYIGVKRKIAFKFMIL